MVGQGASKHILNLFSCNLALDYKQINKAKTEHLTLFPMKMMHWSSAAHRWARVVATLLFTILPADHMRYSRCFTESTWYIGNISSLTASLHKVCHWYFHLTNIEILTYLLTRPWIFSSSLFNVFCTVLRGLQEMTNMKSQLLELFISENQTAYCHTSPPYSLIQHRK
jgi:hypothetical protein